MQGSPILALQALDQALEDQAQHNPLLAGFTQQQLMAAQAQHWNLWGATEEMCRMLSAHCGAISRCAACTLSNQCAQQFTCCSYQMQSIDLLSVTRIKRWWICKTCCMHATRSKACAACQVHSMAFGYLCSCKIGRDAHYAYVWDCG